MSTKPFQLKAWRLHRLLTQAELAERSGVSVRAISQLESLDRPPRILTVAKLAQALAIERVDLFRLPIEGEDR